MLFAVVADKDRLAEGDVVGDRGDRLARALGVTHALVAVILETLCALFGTVHQALVLVVDLAGQLDQQILARRRPHRCNEQVLLRRPAKASGFDAGIGFAVETA